MAELRPAAEVVEDIVRAQGMAPKIAVLQADREALGEIVAHDVVMVATSLGHPPNSSLVEQVTAAVRAVAKPPETERELLAEALWRFECGDAGGDDDWAENAEPYKNAYRKGIAVTLAELEKIREGTDA